MKKLLKNISVVFLSVLFVILAAGCTSPVSKVSTTMNINADGSGERIMRVDINRVDFNDNFAGTFDDLLNLIEEKKAESLSYTKLDDDENFAVIFTLEFSSVDDYNEKMAAIVTDLSEDEKLVYTKAETPWQVGFNIRDSLNATRPLQWLVDAMVDAGFVASGDKGYILGSNSTTYLYNNESLEGMYWGNYNGLSNLYINRIEESVTLFNTDSFNLSLKCYLNSDNYNNRIADCDKSGIVGVFKAQAGENVAIESGDDYILLSYTGLDAKGVNDALAKLFDNAKFEVTYNGNGGQLFASEYVITQGFDVAKYNNPDINASLSVSSQIEYLNDYRNSDNTYFNEYLRNEGNGMLFTNSFTFFKRYNLSKMELETTISDEKNAKQVVTFTLSNSLTQDEQDRLSEGIDKAMTTPSSTYVTPEGEVGDETKFKYDYKATTKDNSYVGELTVKGDIAHVTEGLRRFTGKDAGMSLLSNKSTFKSKYTKSFELKYDLSAFSRYVGEDFVGTATIDMGSGAKNLICSNESALIDKSKVTFRIRTGSVYTTVNAECSNGLATVLILIIILVVIAAIAGVAIYLVKSGVIKKPEAGPAFCPSCGAKLDKGTVFCQSCGTKVK